MEAAGILWKLQGCTACREACCQKTNDEASCLAYQSCCISTKCGCTADHDWGGAAVWAQFADSITRKLQQVPSRVLACLKPMLALASKQGHHLSPPQAVRQGSALLHLRAPGSAWSKAQAMLQQVHPLHALDHFVNSMLWARR